MLTGVTKLETDRNEQAAGGFGDSAQPFDLHLVVEREKGSLADQFGQKPRYWNSKNGLGAFLRPRNGSQEQMPVPNRYLKWFM